MKIGILTQPLHTNYGGLLQAYALQTILKRMGHEVWTVHLNFRKGRFFSIKFIIVNIIRKFLLHSNIFLNHPNKTDISKISQHTDKFIKKNIHTTELILIAKQIKKFKKFRFDAYIVGSDQVWRPKYSTCITNYFLDFVEYEMKTKRIAYAASFGVNNWEYTKNQTTDCARLAKKFDAISVREDSGIDLCREYLGVDASHVLDPTMLLNAKDYIHLIENENEKISLGNLMTYILDKTDEKQQIINDVSEKLNLTAFSVMPSKKLTDETRAVIDECIFPPVTQWLRGFIDAEFVVTDSFHGCVFSIIFNKPFIVIGNPKRGMSRFNSLLKMFKLEERLIDVTESINKDLFIKQIKWIEVNSILKAKRKESLNFLTKNLVF